MPVNVDLASAYLDELTNWLKKDIDNHDFDNKEVMRLVKGWTKIAIVTNGPGKHKRMAAYFLMNRTPSELGANSKRSSVLMMNLSAYESIIEKNGTTSGDFFNRADKAMLDFVWDYRQHTIGQKTTGYTEADFVGQLQNWANLTEDAVMKTEVFQMDRSA
jgi:hypothetical protein